MTADAGGEPLDELDANDADLDDAEDADDEDADDADDEEFDDDFDDEDDEDFDDDDDDADDDDADADDADDDDADDGDEYEAGDVNAVAEGGYEAGDVNTIDGGAAAARGSSAVAPSAEGGGTPVAVLNYLARSMADDPEAVVIRQEERRGSSVLRLHVAPRDMGRVIGRRGRTAQAIRTLVAAAGARDGVQVAVDIVDD